MSGIIAQCPVSPPEKNFRLQQSKVSQKQISKFSGSVQFYSISLVYATNILSRDLDFPYKSLVKRVTCKSNCCHVIIFFKIALVQLLFTS